MTGNPALLRRLRRRRPRSLAALLAAVLAVFATVFLVPPAPAAAAGNSEWSVDPYVPDGTNQNSRRYFFLEGAAGTTVQDVVTVANISDQPLTVKLFGADAFNTPRDGGIALKTVDAEQKDVGKWIQIAPENQTITVPPMKKAHVPFNIVIPPSATPGDHVGGVVALNTVIDGTRQEGQVKLNTQWQIGARVYLRIAGELMPALDVRDVRVERDAGFGQFFGSDEVTVHYTLINRGNVRLNPKVVLEASGLFGRELLGERELQAPLELLPEASITLKTTWKGAPRLDRVNVKVRATADQELEDAESVSYTAVPWPALLILALALLGAGLTWGLIRRHRQGGTGGQGGDPAEPNGPVSPADDTTVLPPVAAEDDENAKAAGDAAEHAVPAGAGGASAKTEPAKTEPAKTEPAKAEPAKTEPAKAEPAKAELPKADSAKADSLKPGEPAKADLTKATSAKAEPAKPEETAAAKTTAKADTAADSATVTGKADAEDTPAEAVTEEPAGSAGAGR